MKFAMLQILSCSYVHSIKSQLLIIRKLSQIDLRTVMMPTHHWVNQSNSCLRMWVIITYMPHIDLPKLLMVCSIKKTNKQEFVKSYWREISKTYLSQKFALYSIGDYMIRQALYFRQLGMGEWYRWMVGKFHRSANED